MPGFKKTILVCLLLLSACSYLPNEPATENISIGFSQLTSNDLWRQTMNAEFERFALLYPEVNLEIRDANDVSAQQIKDIEYFINQNVDVLIVSPKEADLLTPVVEKAYKLGIPVILVDRKTSSDAYTTYIGGDNVEIGRQAGNYAKYLLNGSGRILEIYGTKTSSPAQERHKGFIEQFAEDERFEIIDGGDGQWFGKSAEKVIREVFEEDQAFDLVYAHNDVMAEAAFLVASELGIEDEMFFIGIDALPGKEGGAQMVKDGKLDATLRYLTGGRVAIETAIAIANGDSVPRNITLKTALINSENVEIYQNEEERIQEQQKILEQQQQAITDQLLKFENQRLLLTLIFTLLVGAILILLFLIRASRAKRKINSELKSTNNHLNRMVETNNEINSVIGHDIKTPINSTLAIAELMADSLNDDEPIDKEELQNFSSIIQVSIKSISDLTNDLFNWSRIQAGDLKLRKEHFKISEIVDPTVDLFETMTSFKSITIETIYENDFEIYADKHIVATIVRNFLSNALKFSSKGDTIYLTCEEINDGWSISVKDEGVGMTEEVQQKLFHKEFHPSKVGTKKEVGTGLGLRLSKKMADLHQASIEVKSILGKGSTFTFKVPNTV
ncbi:MAG: substrate-binding domain-containing protein [Balneolaceae bacterium]|nr:substrate-binding domain-containing protein [Balneolaceae bacterium]